MTDQPAAGLVDWSVARSTATRLSGGGPLVAPTVAREVVQGLRQAAAAAVDPVARTALLQPPPAAVWEVAIVDRMGWIEANVEGFAWLLASVEQRLRNRPGFRIEALTAVGSRVTGVQAGGVLAWLAGRILGQFEAFTPNGRSPRLMLVAPNVLIAERALGVDPDDFRAWVALHEQTHWLQFTAVPWLREYLRELLEGYLDTTLPEAGRSGDADPTAEAAGRLREVLAALTALRTGASGLLRVLHTPAQAAAFDRLTAFMTLLEGHAEFIMDAVGPEVIPSVAEIRSRVTRRRAQRRRGPDFVLHRLVGLDGKIRQYDEGCRFVASAVAELGMSGFNVVWSGPHTLPTSVEIANPAAWLSRIR